MPLRIYTSHVAYLRCCTEGAARIDLDGKTAGIVTATEATYASNRLAKIQRRNRATTGASTSTGGTRSAPKRLSMVDLKQAARKRGNGVLKCHG